MTLRRKVFYEFLKPLADTKLNRFLSTGEMRIIMKSSGNR
jgi:hypothetical protein